jgi:hypothetical protein
MVLTPLSTIFQLFRGDQFYSLIINNDYNKDQSLRAEYELAHILVD